MTDLLIQNKW